MSEKLSSGTKKPKQTNLFPQCYVSMLTVLITSLVFTCFIIVNAFIYKIITFIDLPSVNVISPDIPLYF